MTTATHSDTADADHIDTDELADLGEGLLDAEREHQVREHLTSCARCRDTAAALEAVHQQLAGAPTPPMPDDIFARLQAGLESEQQRREDAELRRSTGGLSGPGVPSTRDPYSSAPSYDDSKYQPDRQIAHTHGPSSASDPDDD